MEGRNEPGLKRKYELGLFFSTSIVNNISKTHIFATEHQNPDNTTKFQIEHKSIKKKAFLSRKIRIYSNPTPIDLKNFHSQILQAPSTL